MVIHAMREVCPKCGAAVAFANGVRASGGEISEEPDLPWDGTEGPKRFDTCANGHYFNIRPYFDYDEHYIRQSKVVDEIADLEERLEALNALEAVGG